MKTLYRNGRTLAAAVTLALGSLSIPAQAASFWQSLCPDGAVCATSGKAFVANGRVLLSSWDENYDNQWVNLGNLTGGPTDMHDVSIVTPAGNYMTVYGPEFTEYGPDGIELYGYNHGSVESYILLQQNAAALGPPLYFTGTNPATVFSGFALGGQSPFIYLSQNEGKSATLQSANIPMASGRTNFVTGADGQRVWVIPGPVTPGLWATPVLTPTSTKLDFGHLARIDDGSFPADVVQFRLIQANTSLPGGYAVALARDGMYVSTNFGRTWTRGSFNGVVDDIAFPVYAPATPPATAQPTPATQVVAAKGAIWLSNDSGQSWSELGLGLPTDVYTLTAYNGGIVADGVGGVFWCGGLDCGGHVFGVLSTVGSHSARITEFHNTTLDHYFMTADEGEKAAIRNGAAGPGWVETGQNFWAWTPDYSHESALVCRFYGDPVKGPNSHFYSATASECRQLLGLQVTTPASQPRWNTEGYAFKVSLPDSTGACRSGLVPVYRAYNNGFAQGKDSNHRYVLNRALLAPLVAAGWRDEGLAFCVPTGATD